jgi:hypothetical protein
MVTTVTQTMTTGLVSKRAAVRWVVAWVVGIPHYVSPEETAAYLERLVAELGGAGVHNGLSEEFL